MKLTDISYVPRFKQVLSQKKLVNIYKSTYGARCIQGEDTRGGVLPAATAAVAAFLGGPLTASRLIDRLFLQENSPYS